MSRLDDELRLLYGRKQPSEDFTDRVMRQIAAREAARRPGLWAKLAALFHQPRSRWVAVGAMASLVVALAALQLSRREQAIVESIAAPQVSAVPRASSDAMSMERAPAPAIEAAPRVEAARQEMPMSRKPARRAVRHEPRKSEPRIDQEMIARGEAASRQVMLALQIASATLGEAQKIIQNDTAENEPDARK